MVAPDTGYPGYLVLAANSVNATVHAIDPPTEAISRAEKLVFRTLIRLTHDLAFARDLDLLLHLRHAHAAEVFELAGHEAHFQTYFLPIEEKLLAAGPEKLSPPCVRAFRAEAHRMRQAICDGLYLGAAVRAALAELEDMACNISRPSGHRYIVERLSEQRPAGRLQRLDEINRGIIGAAVTALNAAAYPHRRLGSAGVALSGALGGAMIAESVVLFLPA